MNKLSIATLAAILISGCSSTSKNLDTVNGEFVYPPMPIISDSPYVWDDENSEALNVVKMARPAGIGNSLHDYQDGKNASIGRIGALEGLIDGGLGLMSSGLFTVVQSESLRSGVNNQVEFKPAIVEIVDKALVYENGKPSYKKVRSYIAKKVQDAIEIEHPKIEWGGVYSLYNGVKRFDFQIVINSETECKRVRHLRSGDENAEPFMRRNFSEIFVDGENSVRDYCSFGFYMNVPYETEDGEKVVIVAEMQSGTYFVEDLVNNYDGYVVIPDIYFFNTKRAIKTDYAYVSKKGKQLLFQK